MMTKLANMFVILSALAAFGVVSSSALAESVKDTGGFDGTYAKRDVQPIPDQDGHILMLTESKATAANPGGPLDGFSVTVREIVDLNQGTGPQQGYVIYNKGSDQLVVKIDGQVTTTMKDGKPNTTFKGNYVFVNGSGALAGAEGKGTYAGYFTAEDKYHVDWDGMRSSGPRTN